jgi:hypothetical protein
VRGAGGTVVVDLDELAGRVEAGQASWLRVRTTGRNGLGCTLHALAASDFPLLDCHDGAAWLQVGFEVKESRLILRTQEFP